MNTTYIKGVEAENKALEFLNAKGMILINKRLKTPHGEIDLLMQDQETIVAVEVKFRKKLLDASYSLSATQMKRIQNALTWWISREERFSQCTPMQRFDVVLLYSNNKITYFKNAWLVD